MQSFLLALIKFTKFALRIKYHFWYVVKVCLKILLQKSQSTQELFTFHGHHLLLESSLLHIAQSRSHPCDLQWHSHILPLVFMLSIICPMSLMVAYVEIDKYGNIFIGNPSNAPLGWSTHQGPVPQIFCIATLQSTLHFVLLGIPASNNFTLQIMYKKSVHWMILFYSHFQN